MSVKIDQIIDVVEKIKEALKLNPNTRDFSSLRRQATKAIAARRGKHETTIPDKFIRGLLPDIGSTPDFDRYLEAWVFNNSSDLETILLKHAIGDSDRKRISSALFIAPEPDAVLAHEFGFDPNEQSFKEGKERFRLHRDKERNPNLIRQAKENWMTASKGNLSCDVCNFSFSKTYGKIGVGFIEAHHKIPISSFNSDTVVEISDLAPVCSNCHSMLHRHHNPWLSVEQLKEMIIQQRIRFAG